MLEIDPCPLCQHVPEGISRDGVGMFLVACYGVGDLPGHPAVEAYGESQIQAVLYWNRAAHPILQLRKVADAVRRLMWEALLGDGTVSDLAVERLATAFIEFDPAWRERSGAKPTRERRG